MERGIIALEKDGNRLVCAMDDPNDVVAIDVIQPQDRPEGPSVAQLAAAGPSCKKLSRVPRPLQDSGRGRAAEEGPRPGQGADPADRPEPAEPGLGQRPSAHRQGRERHHHRRPAEARQRHPSDAGQAIPAGEVPRGWHLAGGTGPLGERRPGHRQPHQDHVAPGYRREAHAPGRHLPDPHRGPRDRLPRGHHAHGLSARRSSCGCWTRAAWSWAWTTWASATSPCAS